MTSMRISARQAPRPFPPSHMWSDKLERDLSELEATYAQHASKFDQDWLDYGELDPLDFTEALVFPDAASGARPTLARVDDRTVRLMLGDEPVGSPARFAWQVMCEWNGSERALKPDWRSFPFFWLPEEIHDAKYKLGQLRSHLEIRCRLYKLRLMSGQRVGSQFLNRLKAYRLWCELGQRIVKDAIKASRTVGEDSSAS